MPKLISTMSPMLPLRLVVLHQGKLVSFAGGVLSVHTADGPRVLACLLVPTDAHTPAKSHRSPSLRTCRVLWSEYPELLLHRAMLAAAAAVKQE